MPSALETLVKILKLERDQGYNDSAVIGGLGAFAQEWTANAHRQARIEMHHLLVDDLAQLMEGYAEVEGKNERHEIVSYMLDRVMMRVKVPREDFVPREDWSDVGKADSPPEKQPSTPPRSDKSSAVARERAAAAKAGRPKPPESSPATSTVNNHTPLEVEFEEAHADAELDLPLEPRLESPPRGPRPDADPEELADLMRGLAADVTAIKGVGKRMGETLANLKTRAGRAITTVDDMLAYYPLRYDDYTKMLPIAKLDPEMTVTVIGTVRNTHVRVGGGGRKDFAFQLDDGTARLQIVMFGQGWMRNKVRDGDQLVVSGETDVYRNQLQLKKVEWEPLETDNLQSRGIVPVYRLTEGLKAKRLRGLMETAVGFWSARIPDYMPLAVLERNDLADLGWAIDNVHFPKGWDYLYHARRRLTFDDLTLMQLTLLQNRRVWQEVPADPITVTVDWLNDFIGAVFPYELTGAQRRTVDEILDDVAHDVPMNRMVQGDVGAGKTAVAIIALAATVANGKQAALMAPTSILAEQHFKSVSEALANTPGDHQPSVALLTGSLKKAERDAVYAGLADGSIDVIVGTHALFQAGVHFNNLGLAIVDEQHRFGVEQRGTLRGKGTNPHFLSMSATPIPRSLALVQFADLDLSIIDEMPPGRTPVKTHIQYPNKREVCYDFIKRHLEEGRQAFIVHPLVEASDKIDAPAAVENFEKLQRVFYEHRVGLLHGQMKPDEKDKIMHAFAAGEFDVMVTTSVAEVGVNIPNATVMMIEGANRFGLSQLHQFRGRVGRGQYPGYCLLVPDTTTETAEQRLQIMTETTDGFVLAEKDLELRGVGDLLGTRQSSHERQISFPEEVTPELTEMAHREARTIYAEDPDLELPEHALLRQRIEQLKDRRSDVS
jgi:ATP-dependent DNA helicase RecG